MALGRLLDEVAHLFVQSATVGGVLAGQDTAPVHALAVTDDTHKVILSIAALMPIEVPCRKVEVCMLHSPFVNPPYPRDRLASCLAE